MRKVAAALMLSVLVPPSLAEADSDGYFCVGHDYLAFEMRIAGPTSVRHELHVLRLSEVDAFVLRPPVLLEDFQVHGMVCGSGAVELLAWRTAYTVDISNAERPTVTSRPEAFDSARARPAENLGHWAREQVLDFPVKGSARYQLVTARVSQRVPGGVEHHTVTRLVQRSANVPSTNGISASLKLFEGIFRETVD
jgi:hypothetical protein